MPTYEYRCPNGHDFDQFFRKISDAQAEFACPECGALGVRRVSGGAGLLFKGSGFYLTDYGKNAHRKGGSDTGGDGKGGSSGDGTGGKAGESAKSDASTAAAKSGAGSGAKASGTQGGESKSSGGKSTSGESK